MQISSEMVHRMVWLAGLGQLALVVGSLAIPRVLRWQEELAPISNPLIRQVFWVYSIYIWTTNLCFGLISALAPGWLLKRDPLGSCVCGFIALYWTSRVFIQIFYFDRSQVPDRFIFKVGEVALMGLFIALSLIYGFATLYNLGW